MKGSTSKRCQCDPEYDSKGRRKNCPRKHGSWSFVLDAGKDPATGKRRQVRKSGFRTQNEAAAAMAEVMSEVDAGRYRHDDRQTVAQYLATWIEGKSETLRPTTRAGYRREIGKAVPHIGHLRLRELQPGHLTVMYRKLLAESRARGHGATNVEKVHVMIRSALSDAKRAGLIRDNPAQDATVPRRDKAKIRPWSGTELGTFLDHVGGHPLGPIYELIAMTGMRRGEALALRWQDVNLTDGYLTVRQQLTSVHTAELLGRPCPSCGVLHKAMAFGPPKTSSGDARRIDLGQAATGVLLAQKLAQDAERAQWGDAYVDHDLVFSDVDGNPLRPNHVTKTFNALSDEAGLRRIRLHDLRHGRASLMLAAGVDMAIVSKVLGHSTIRLTADTYSHLLEGVGKKAAEAADSLIVRQIRDQSVTNSGGETAEASPG